MRHERGLTRWVGCSLALAVLLAAMTVTLAGQGYKRFLTGPLTIEDQGSFFIGGVPKVTEHAAPGPAAPGQPSAALLPHQITIGQMYVQFQIPARKYAAGWPVIMVHGSSHTGACLESTPDGREGWYPYFVRKGVPTYALEYYKQLVPNAEVTLPGSTCGTCDLATVSPANMPAKGTRREFMHAAGFAATGMMASAAALPAAGPVAQGQQAAAPRTMGARFRDLLQKRIPFENISVHDVLSARMTEMLGFPSLFLGSSAVSEFHAPGIQEHGNVDEVCKRPETWTDHTGRCQSHTA